MKKTLFLIAALACMAFGAKAQRLIIGERAPELRISQWLGEIRPADEHKARLVEFFHSSNKICLERLQVLDELAQKYGNSLEVIVFAKEPSTKIIEVVQPAERKFATALDDAGRTFTLYGVRFVPFTVLTDSRGRVVWFGNPSSLTEEIILKNTK